jgi:mono/diheme cytochrome c family protein
MKFRAMSMLVLLGVGSACESESATPPHAHDGAVRDAGPRGGAHAHHGGVDSADAAARPDASDPGSPSLRARGEYLVRHVSGCVDCHAPRKPSGAFDESKLLSGVRNLVDLEPDDDARGLLHSRNLTPDDETGLGEWSDDEIKNAFLHGMSRDDRVLHWTMPSWIYHNMEPRDADAIVAYLRSLPAIQNDVPDPQPLSTPLDAPYHLPEDVIPRSWLDPFVPDAMRAERGRYLATSVGLCIYCHSPPSDDRALPVDVTRLFAGRRPMLPVRLGTESEVPVEDRNTLIETRNLTPHETGLGAWSPAQVADALRLGVSRSGLPVCDPMPSTYGGSLLGMRADDALDIGIYLTTLPPQDSGRIPECCTACHGNTGADADGGA